MRKMMVLVRFVMSLALVLSAGLPAWSAEKLQVVENKKVCMVNNAFMFKDQIPVQHNGKTYYGCCENCKKTLSEDANARTAIDPVSNKPVDKASAVIAMREDFSVLYFENMANFNKYQKSSGTTTKK